MMESWASGLGRVENEHLLVPGLGVDGTRDDPEVHDDHRGRQQRPTER